MKKNIFFVTVCLIIVLSLTEKNISSANNIDKAEQKNVYKENLNLRFENLKAKSISINQVNNKSSKQLNSNLEDSGQKQIYLGKFIASSYCTEKYKHICNNGDEWTAMGDLPIPLKTVAVDTDIIPLGTKLRIKNDNIDIYVTANDRGTAIKGKRIDIVNKTHKQALEWGKQEVDVWVIE